MEQAFNIKEVTAQAEGIYTFTMPANAVYVGAAFYQDGVPVTALSNETAETLTFAGLAAVTEYSVRVYASNIGGCTTYMTETVMTAALVETPFDDVLANEYYSNAVLWALQNNITTGVTAANFGVGSDCTRAMVVTFLYRLFA